MTFELRSRFGATDFERSNGGGIEASCSRFGTIVLERLSGGGILSSLVADMAVRSLEVGARALEVRKVGSLEVGALEQKWLKPQSCNKSC